VEATSELIATICGARIQIVAVQRRTRGTCPCDTDVAVCTSIGVIATGGVWVVLTTAGGNAAVVGANIAVVAR
jgi:hypothetical protein